MYNTKIIITNAGIELYKYSKVIPEGCTGEHGGGRNGNGDRNRRSTLHKAKTKIIRIVNSNTWTLFITMTYAYDVDIGESKQDIRKFIRRLRCIYPKVKYLYVLELTKRGRVHYHMLIDAIVNIENMQEYERYLAKIWGHGFIDVKEITNPRGAGFYISKYLTKDAVDTSYKLYGYSTNCNKPIEVKCLDTRDSIDILQELNKNVTYTNSYTAVYTKNLVNYYVLEDKEDN